MASVGPQILDHTINKLKLAEAWIEQQAKWLREEDKLLYDEWANALWKWVKTFGTQEIIFSERIKGRVTQYDAFYKMHSKAHSLYEKIRQVDKSLWTWSRKLDRLESLRKVYEGLQIKVIFGEYSSLRSKKVEIWESLFRIENTIRSIFNRIITYHQNLNSLCKYYRTSEPAIRDEVFSFFYGAKVIASSSYSDLQRILNQNSVQAQEPAVQAEESAFQVPDLEISAESLKELDDHFTRVSEIMLEGFRGSAREWIKPQPTLTVGNPSDLAEAGSST